jgi:hypothetical protein
MRPTSKGFSRSDERRGVPRLLGSCTELDALRRGIDSARTRQGAGQDGRSPCQTKARRLALDLVEAILRAGPVTTVWTPRALADASYDRRSSKAATRSRPGGCLYARVQLIPGQNKVHSASSWRTRMLGAAELRTSARSPLTRTCSRRLRLQAEALIGIMRSGFLADCVQLPRNFSKCSPEDGDEEKPSPPESGGYKLIKK